MQHQAVPTQNEMVDIVCMGASRPLIRGRLVSIKNDVCRVDVGFTSLVVPMGASTIVSFPSGSVPRIEGQVLALQRGELIVSCETINKPERRSARAIPKIADLTGRYMDWCRKPGGVAWSLEKCFGRVSRR